MWLQIRRAGELAAAGDLVDDLSACHQRIRRFSALAVRIAEVDRAGAAELAEGAQAVHRYFTVALPLHVADEDDSLASRLRLASPPDEVLGALERMSIEHGPIEALVAELAPAWSRVAREPDRHRELAASLAPARRLVELLDPHLAAEERWIFPAIRTHLTSEVRAAIHEEMRRRRR